MAALVVDRIASLPRRLGRDAFLRFILGYGDDMGMASGRLSWARMGAGPSGEYNPSCNGEAGGTFLTSLNNCKPEPGSNTEADMADMVRKILAGRYRVDEFIGKGGMAEVYKVWDSERAVYLAVKVLYADLAEDQVFLRRFTREAETLSSLQHHISFGSTALSRTEASASC